MALNVGYSSPLIESTFLFQSEKGIQQLWFCFLQEKTRAGCRGENGAALVWCLVGFCHVFPSSSDSVEFTYSFRDSLD